MKLDVTEVTSVEEAQRLHKKVISEFVEEAAKALDTRHAFAYTTKIESRPSKETVSLSFGGKKYMTKGKAPSDALYEHVVMPCEWLVLRWKQELCLRLKPVHEDGALRNTLLSVARKPFSRDEFTEINKTLLLECERMCNERNAAIMQTAVFG